MSPLPETIGAFVRLERSDGTVQWVRADRVLELTEAGTGPVCTVMTGGKDTPVEVFGVNHFARDVAAAVMRTEGRR